VVWCGVDGGEEGGSTVTREGVDGDEEEVYVNAMHRNARNAKTVMEEHRHRHITTTTTTPMTEV
jgi:hypothetical protein